MVPVVMLRIETLALYPPKPIGGGVFHDNILIGVFTLKELRACVKQLEELEKARDEAKAR